MSQVGRIAPPLTGRLGRAAIARSQRRGRLPQDEAVERNARLDDGSGCAALPEGDGQESRLSYLGHALMENRNGLVVAAEATLATGTAEREAAERLSERLPEGATLGADKNYDAEPSSRG
jgi:hypothetical protein